MNQDVTRKKHRWQHFNDPGSRPRRLLDRRDGQNYNGREIMASTMRKYTASFHTPFMTPPLVNEVGYLATGRAAEEILNGSYIPPPGLDVHTISLLKTG